MQHKTLIAIMAGGSGARLWPLSKKEYPKQFLDLDNSGVTMFQSVVLRARNISNNLLIIGNFTHRFIILEQLRQLNLDSQIGQDVNIILEPMSKNTLATATIATLFAQKHNFDNVLLMPSDQIMHNDQTFLVAVENVSKFFTINRDTVLTFGITPTYANIGYGYIEKTSENLGNSVYRSKGFTEKPSAEIAEKYLKNNTHLWNCGMFFFDTTFFINKLEEFEKQTVQIVQESIDNCTNSSNFCVLSDDIFQKIKANSIDFAIMQKLDCISYIEIQNSGWSDLGSFFQIYEHSHKDENNNSISENVYINSSSQSHIINKTDMKIVISDVDDLLVVAVDDIITITKNDKQANLIKYSKTIDCFSDQDKT